MRRRKYTKEILEGPVRGSKSVAEVIRKLGMGNSGGNHELISKRIKEYGLNTSHFKNSAWNKGLTKENSEIVRRTGWKNQKSDEEVFKKGSSYPRSKLYDRLVQLGRTPKCENEKCGIKEWHGKFLRLHVDHINGIRDDHRLENLRFLCPNCHQQTETWGNGISRKKTYFCKECEIEIGRQAERCVSCAGIQKMRGISKRPSESQLRIDKQELKTYAAIGRKYGVSGNAVKKWQNFYLGVGKSG